ncbi:MAG: hypothetical protein AAFY11_01920 [Cyanobacteria bacterium J06641_5]
MQQIGATRAQSITIAELQDNLLHYLQEVEAGASITIIGDDGAIAALRPIVRTTPAPTQSLSPVRMTGRPIASNNLGPSMPVEILD